ncbi:MAG: methyl-accepting chemotaxis protein [Spirochaetota bacterium]|nr:methyl-accepting chemotaxis protein [Spirochaetota bacterium]
MKDYLIFGCIVFGICIILIFISYLKSKWNLRSKIFALLLFAVSFCVMLGFTVGDLGFTILTISIVSPFGVIVSTIAVLYLNNMIVKPINEMLSVVESIAIGDFTKVSDYKSNDELGSLSSNMNIAVQNIHDMIQKVVISSKNLVKVVEEIAGGNQNLSQRTTEQASSLEEIAATIEESAATISQNSENSMKAKELSINTNGLAEKGGKTITEAIMSINEINESSKKIGDIIIILNEISFQTNLLALNAAVEAARAGEHGRGFAVVAGEVRNLAQRASSSSKDISDLIKDSVEKIDKGTRLVNESGVALKNIIEATKNVGAIVTETAISSEEQKLGIEQINDSVTQLDSMTQQNAALVEQTSVASEEMSRLAKELLDMVEKFKLIDNVSLKQNIHDNIETAEV